MAQPFVFISYSRQDETEKDALLTHLKGLQQVGQLTLWSDDKIRPGTNWQESMAQAIDRANIALLLVTANYLASDFITEEEIPALLARQAEEGLRIIPIIAKPCAWQAIDWLAELEVRPQSQQPVWREDGRYADQELAAIASEIAAIHIYNLPDASVSPTKPVPAIDGEDIPECPYRGLFAFRPEHAPYFFGLKVTFPKASRPPNRWC